MSDNISHQNIVYSEIFGCYINLDYVRFVRVVSFGVTQVVAYSTEVALKGGKVLEGPNKYKVDSSLTMTRKKARELAEEDMHKIAEDLGIIEKELP